MKLFGRSSGYYLFWTGFIYFWVGMYLAFTHAANTEYASMAFVLALSVPLWCPPVARYFNMEPVMFNLFAKKDKEDNVVKFPELKSVPPMPAVQPPAPKEKDPITFYRLGLTDNNRVSFNMGYTEITMSAKGCQQMIDQLTFFQSQLYDESGPEDDPDGGEPVPVPEEDTEAKAKKAA
jgi:hypothetical protein